MQLVTRAEMPAELLPGMQKCCILTINKHTSNIGTRSNVCLRTIMFMRSVQMCLVKHFCNVKVLVLFEL